MEKQDGLVPIFELSRQLNKKQHQWKTQKQQEVPELLDSTAANKEHNEIRSKEHREALRDRNWVTKKVAHYLSTTAAADQQSERCHELLRQLDAKARADPSWELMPLEKLQILDCRPSSPAELLLIVERCQERFDEKGIAEFLALINEYLPPAFEEDDDEEEDDENEDEEDKMDETTTATADADNDDNHSDIAGSFSLPSTTIAPDAGMHPADLEEDEDEIEGEDYGGGSSSKKSTWGYKKVKTRGASRGK